MPNMIVIDPADCIEFEGALCVCARHYGPVYIRIGRGPMAQIFDKGYCFDIGKAVVMDTGTDATLITTGITTLEGIRACKSLKKKGFQVRHIHMPTIKPVDKEIVIKAAKETGIIFTADFHFRIGGLGGAIAETICAEYPVKVYTLGINDCFGETGRLEWLLERFGISGTQIAGTIEKELKII